MSSDERVRLRAYYRWTNDPARTQPNALGDWFAAEIEERAFASSVVSETRVNNNLLTVACLGWGSLIWNPGNLPIRTPWFTDGPLLPIEFARFSSRSRVTLVIAEDQPEVRSLWALMTTETLEAAVNQLASREGVTANIDRDIGRWKLGDAGDDRITRAISTWAIQHQLDAVVWTALARKTHRENDRAPSFAEIIARLRQAEKENNREPREYIEKAPRQIDTAIRREINRELGWTCRSDI